MAENHQVTEQNEDNNSEDDRSSYSDSSDSEIGENDVIELNPTREFKKAFMFAHLKAIRDLYPPYDDDQVGKWMMFFHKKILDDKWKQYCDLYKAGKLEGIKKMVVSTSLKNPRTEDHSRGVILFYCGPANDETFVMECGKKLLAIVPYHSRSPIFYKTEEQTRSGTRATGQKINHLYKLYPPESSRSQLSEDNIELNPTQEFEKLFLHAKLKAIQDLYTSYEDDETGKWTMSFNEDVLDEKWKTCCDLYRAGKLVGIKEMRVSTNYYKPITIDKMNGVIQFFCGPAYDESLVRSYGRKLVEVVRYNGKFPLYYKRQELRTLPAYYHKQSHKGTRATGRNLNHLYTIYKHESECFSPKNNYAKSDTMIENWRSKK